MRETMNARNLTAIYEMLPYNRMDGHAALAQIGHMNRLAITGGRATIGYHCVILPVSHGYHVVVSLAADDTYTVQRVFLRGGKASVKGEWTGIYADRLSDVAYTASLS